MSLYLVMLVVALLLVTGGAASALTAQGTYACEEADMRALLAAVQREQAAAEAQGYVPLDVGGEVARAQEILAELAAAPGFHYDEGFRPERAVRYVQVKEALLRAKGALIRLKLPYWTRDVRYAGLDEIATDPADRIRGLGHLSV